MPLRYLILVGRRETPIAPLALAAAERTGLAISLSIGPIAILTNEENGIIPMAHDRGCVVGTLFRRDVAAPRIRSFEDLDPGRSFDPRRILHEQFWGAYLSVTLGRDEVTVSRDPSGLLPCLYVAKPDILAFASDAALLEESGFLSPDIDWPALARLLFANELPQQNMALSGVSDLHAGMSARIAGGGVALSMAWSPWTRTQADPNLAPDDAAARLAETVDRCVGSWARDYRRVAVAVSGGLDSSIIAASLMANAGTDTIGLTISTDEPRGDESAYARALCAHLGVPLVEGRYETEAVDFGRSASAHLTRPAGRAPIQAYDAVVHREMAAQSADAFFTGSGGDNVFYSTHSVRPLIDRFLIHGWHRGLFGTARDISAVTGASLWSVLRFSARVPRTRGVRYQWQGDPRFLSEEVKRLNLALPLSHPWLEAPEDCLPGKASHVAMILRAQHYLDNYDRRLPFAAIHPLLSQPIVELMLSMPSWFAVVGGRDRAVARKAFADRFPQVIAERRIKGGPDAFASQLLQSKLARARERLLAGALCGEGIVDRKVLESALSETNLVRGHDYVRLLFLLDTEAWIENWTGPGRISGRARSSGQRRPVVADHPDAHP